MTNQETIQLLIEALTELAAKDKRSDLAAANARVHQLETELAAALADVAKTSEHVKSLSSELGAERNRTAAPPELSQFAQVLAEAEAATVIASQRANLAGDFLRRVIASIKPQKPHRVECASCSGLRPSGKNATLVKHGDRLLCYACHAEAVGGMPPADAVAEVKP